MKKLFYAFSALALLFASCSSDSDSSSDDSSSAVLVRRLVETSGADEFTTILTYNGNKIVKATDDDGYYEKYFYTGDLITKIEWYNDLDELEQTENFTYNGNQQLIMHQVLDHLNETGSKKDYVHGTSSIAVTYYEGDLTSQTTATGTGSITLSGGEIITITTDFGTDTTTHFTYDGKNSPFKNVLGLDKIAISDSDALLNGGIYQNMLTAIESSGGDEITTTATYTYNAANYPVTVNVSDNVVADWSIQFFYD